MKYCLGGMTYMPAISDFFTQYCTRCGCVRTEEFDSNIHCVNGLNQNADCYMNQHGVDSLNGLHGKSFRQGVTEQMHKHSWHSQLDIKEIHCPKFEIDLIPMETVGVVPTNNS